MEFRVHHILKLRIVSCWSSNVELSSLILVSIKQHQFYVFSYDKIASLCLLAVPRLSDTYEERGNSLTH